MKKLLLSVAVMSALGLTGCLSDGTSAPTTEEEASTPFTRVVFDPEAGELPIPSDILLGGTTDGTLNIPVDDPENFGDPQNAINALDGWSTLMPMTFEFNNARDSDGTVVAINPDSVTASGGIRVFRATMGADASDEECAAAPAGTACRVEEELEFGTDFTVMYDDGEATVLPLRPLRPKTGYLVVLTDNITDDLGRGVRPSQTYAVARKDDVELEGQGAQLQGIIQSYESALSAYGVSQDNIAYASGFTTQSVDDVLQTVQALMAGGELPVNPIQAQSTGQTAAAYLQLSTDDPNYGIASAAVIYGGEFGAPYFSGIPTEDDPEAPLTARWQAGFISPASIVTALQQELVTFDDLVPLMEDPGSADPSNPASLAGQIPFAAAEAAESPLAELDSGRHLTKFNPIPAPRTVQDIPLMMSVPDVDTVNAVRAQLGMEAISEPENGWPVTIFQHGITGNKEQFLAIAGALAVSGHAAISIDHPLHGERGFEGINASGEDGDPTAYLNLSSLLTARDNVRQSTSDLLALRYALNDTSGVPEATLNGNDVKFLGHSLGAIAGTNFTAVANSPFMGLPEDAPNPFAVVASTLGMPGGGIAPFLLESESFGPLIGAQLSFQEIEPFRTAALEAAENAGIVPGSDEFTSFLPEFYVQFFAEAPDQLVAGRDSLLSQFQFAAQTVVDSADPINYAATVQETETPVYLIQANGDAVIPNSTSFPTSGTDALANALGLPVRTSTVQSEDGSPVSGYVRFEGGSHGSLLDPGSTEESAAVTRSMQLSTGVYFENNALVLPVDEELVN